MISAATILRIQRMSHDGQTSRKIAETLGINQKTVLRYLKDPARGLRERDLKPRTSKLARFSREQWCEFVQKAKCNYVVIAKHLENIARHDDPEFTVDASTVRRYIRKNYPDLDWRTSTQETRFFKVEPGQQLQIDFVKFEFTFAHDDRPQKLLAFEAVYSYSRKIFIRLCPDMKQLSWYLSVLECLSTWGIPREILCDNDPSLVFSHTKNGTVFNRGFEAAVCKPLGIKPRACKPARACTKGRVERLGGYFKGNCLTQAALLGSISNITELQVFIDAWMQTDVMMRKFNIAGKQYSCAELWQEEQKYLQKAACSPSELYLFAGELWVKDDGSVTAYGHKMRLTYNYRNRQVVCYVRPDGEALFLSVEGLIAGRCYIPAQNLKLYSFDSEPPTPSRREIAEVEEQRMTDELNSIQNQIGAIK